MWRGEPNKSGVKIKNISKGHEKWMGEMNEFCRYLSSTIYSVFPNTLEGDKKGCSEDAEDAVYAFFLAREEDVE